MGGAVISGFLDYKGNSISYSYYKCQKAETTIFSIHGGGVPGKERVEYIAEAVRQFNISFLSFDHTGHGLSSGKIKESSLSRRVDEALAIMRLIKDGSNIIVMGTSMGGYIATEIVRRNKADALMLFCPAMYTDNAFDLSFGEGFTEEIRKPLSYLNTNVEESIRTNTKKSIIFACEDDDVIPEEVISKYWSSIRKSSFGKKIVLPQCPHWVHKYACDNRKIRNLIIQEIASFAKL
ncbi:alpha/beta hydrolase [Neptunicella sp. SCSIO 80796]|uniref:alpha/beta hydrolase n=1 Tax=Neptunicella plasticusilytica TaxID=3117012 RepID=UPI003A4E5437